MKRQNNKRFSAKYDTPEQWLSGRPKNAYTIRMSRKMAEYPGATLSQLRGHPKAWERPLNELTRKPLSQLPWDVLTPEEKDGRIMARAVYRMMVEEGVTLSEASRFNFVPMKSVLDDLDAFKKENGRWVPKTFFMNEVPMNINTDGRSIFIMIRDYRHASTLGKYHNAVRWFLETQDLSYLTPFIGRSVIDSQGKRYILETRPNMLYEIRERRVDEEFYSIYGD